MKDSLDSAMEYETQMNVHLLLNARLRKKSKVPGIATNFQGGIMRALR
jgi:hypothetical protein